MNPLDSIRRFAKVSARALVALGLIKGLVRAAPFFIGAVLALAALDHAVEIPVWGLRLLWFTAVVVTIMLAASGFFPLSMFSLGEMARNLRERMPSLRSDDLRLAVELSQQPKSEGVSDELRQEFLAQAAQKISSCRPWWCFPRWDWRKSLAVLAVVLTVGGTLWAFFPGAFELTPNILFPFSSANLERSIKVEPGDATVPMGRDAVVTLTVLEKSLKDPVLEVKGSDQWVTMDAEIAGGGVYTFTMKKVTTPIVYRVLWKKEVSRKFTLTPVEAARFTDFDIQVQPPDYLGRQPMRQTSPEITSLVGSRVRMEATSNFRLSLAALVFSDGREVRAARIDDNKAFFDFSIDQSGTYSFVLTPLNGAAIKSEEVYPVHVTQDQAPSVTLLSPDQDLVVGQKEKLPFTFDARDDYGLGEATLEWESKRSGVNRTRIKRFEASVENIIHTYEWDLALQGFQAGEVIRCRVEVSDKNTLTGPGKAASAWRIIEIKSFEQEHALVEKALEAWRNKALETLAQVTTLKARVDQENADLSALSQSFSPPEQNLQMLEEALKQIVNRMENDPMADYGVWLEHKEMKENMSVLNQTEAKEARAAFQTKNKPAASFHLDQIANELERMSALSEDLSKAQKARDVTQAGENLEDIGDDLMKSLEAAENEADKSAMAAKIKDLLAEAQKNLAEMARALQQMPDELPEDFVNQEALKNLEINKSQDILSQIAEAVKRGDMKQAMELAKKFAEAAKAMRQQLSKAHDSFLKSNSAESVGEEIAEQQEALEKIANQQRQVLAETQKLASQRLEAVMKSQEKMLAELAARQEKVIAATDALLKTDNRTPAAFLMLSTQLRPMNEVLLEFRAKRLDRSAEYLNTIVAQVGIVRQELVRSSATTTSIDKVGEIRDEEAAILELIKNPPQPKQELSSQDKQRYSDLDSKQQALRKETQGVKEKLQMISRKTATLGPELMRSLKQAGDDMKNASESLAGGDAPSAQRSEEKALDGLLQGQSALGQAQSAMSDMASEQGEPGEGKGGSGKGPQVIMRNAPGGSRGNQTGKVKLPSAEDYRPPKAFREDLMESLKENYPQIYEEIIHKYYKRLAE